MWLRLSGKTRPNQTTGPAGAHIPRGGAGGVLGPGACFTSQEVKHTPTRERRHHLFFTESSIFIFIQIRNF